MGSQQFCLRWNNHQTNMLSVFDKLLLKEAFVDVTIACEGSTIKAHKMVLSACSPFFEDLFSENPCKHPIVILRDMSYSDLKSIVEFMYKGEVNVSQDKLNTLLKAAESLQIKGLTEMTDQHHNAEPDHRKNFQQPITVPAGNFSRSPSNKRKRRKNSNGSPNSKVSIIPKSPSPPEIIEEPVSKLSPSLLTEDQDTPSSRNRLLQEAINGSDTGLDPSSFMQQSLTENQAYEQQLGYSNQSSSGGNDQKIHESSKSNISPEGELKSVKQEADEEEDSYYMEDVPSVLPEPKQELLERGVTMVPLSDQSLTGQHVGSETLDDLDYSSNSQDQTGDSDMVITSGPSVMDQYSLSGVLQSERMHHISGGMILPSSENREGIAGPSGEHSTSPGRSTQGTGPRYHSKVIASVLLNQSGTLCPFCYRSFSSRMSLVRHVKCIHTDLDSIVKFGCPKCNKTYVRKDKLHDHLASVHHILPPNRLTMTARSTEGQNYER